MPELPDKQQTCDHKWVHLRNVGDTQTGYRSWATVDEFFCERCLKVQTVETEKPELNRYRY